MVGELFVCVCAVARLLVCLFVCKFVVCSRLCLVDNMCVFVLLFVGLLGWCHACARAWLFVRLLAWLVVYCVLVCLMVYVFVCEMLCDLYDCLFG